MRLTPAVLIVVATASGCGSGSGRHGVTPTGPSPPPAAPGRIERCVDRLLQNATQTAADKGAARRYVRKTYCARFEKKGWIYEDGALRIAAQIWLDKGYRCTSDGGGAAATAVPCRVDVSGGVRTLECALLHAVRKSEVGEYVERLRAGGPVTCDDGTPLGDLGVP